MGSKPDKTQSEPEIIIDESENVEQKMLIYTLLRIFHVFINVISNINHDNIEVVISILRDFRTNFEGFYQKLYVFFERFCKELQKLEELTLTTEHLESEKRFVVRIALNYSNIEKEATIPDSPKNQLHVAKPLDGKFGYSPKAKSSTTQKSHLTLEDSLQVTRLMRDIAQTMLIPLNLPFLQFFHNVNKHNVQKIELPDTPKPIEEAQKELEQPDSDHITVDLELPPIEVEPTSTFLNDMLKDLSLKPPELDTPCNEDNSVVEEMSNDYQKIIDSVPVVNIPQETFDVGTSSPFTERFVPEEDSPEEQEVKDAFKEKLEQQNQEFRIKMEALKEERRRKREAREAEFKDLRRQQKQRFDALISCIFLKQRFEEKESEWSSWIENSLRKLIVKVVGKFGDFQDMAKNYSNFKKLRNEDPEDVISGIGDLNKAILTLLYDLEAVFNKLAKVDQDFESVNFIRVIQKRICKVATNLNELLLLLEEISYTEVWYQNLEQKMTEIQPNQIPTTTELKRICKNLKREDYENLEFPKWENKSHVVIEEFDEEDDKQDESKAEEEPNEQDNSEVEHNAIDSVNDCDDQSSVISNIVPELRSDNGNEKSVEEFDDEEVIKKDEEPDEIEDEPPETDNCEDQVRCNEEISEAAPSGNGEESRCINAKNFANENFETNSSTCFTVPISEKNEPRNENDTLEMCETLCRSSELETCTLGTDYNGDEVTRHEENCTIGPETSFPKSCDTVIGCSCSGQPEHPTESLNHEVKDDSNQDDSLENVVENAEQAIFDHNGFSPDREVSKFMDPISPNQLQTDLPPRCGSVSPGLNDSLKSEPGDSSFDNAVKILIDPQQKPSDEPVSSRTRSRAEAVKNSSDENRKRCEQLVYEAHRNSQMYDKSGVRHRLNSNRQSKF